MEKFKSILKFIRCANGKECMCLYLMVLSFFLFVSTSPVVAQQQHGVRVNGVVLDEKGDPLAGVTVVNRKDRSNGTITNVRGNYALFVNSLKDSLEFSFLGYEKQVIVARDASLIRMEPDDMQLDEVVVTQRSSDGGIDLEAIRYGVGGLAGADSVEYYVQAKRNKPGTTISIEKVRALRGVMPSGSKGIFVTTAGYSKKTQEFVDADPSRPIILIDGKALVESCIDNEIGFVFTPVFSKNAMDALKDTSDDLHPRLSSYTIKPSYMQIHLSEQAQNRFEWRLLPFAPSKWT